MPKNKKSSLYFISEDKIGKKVMDFRGKRIVSVPDGWDIDKIRVYPAEIIYKVVGDGSNVDVNKIKGKKYAVVPDNITSEYVVVVKLKPVNFKNGS